uniref:DUF432 domain-containing protein n=1 Tax=Panagrellus redivivus TaxID=6233 RepID=A0A7E4UQB7_PANRE
MGAILSRFLNLVLPSSRSRDPAAVFTNNPEYAMPRPDALVIEFSDDNRFLAKLGSKEVVKGDQTICCRRTEGRVNVNLYPIDTTPDPTDTVIYGFPTLFAIADRPDESITYPTFDTYRSPNGTFYIVLKDNTNVSLILTFALLIDVIFQSAKVELVSLKIPIEIGMIQIIFPQYSVVLRDGIQDISNNVGIDVLY